MASRKFSVFLWVHTGRLQAVLIVVGTPLCVCRTRGIIPARTGSKYINRVVPTLLFFESSIFHLNIYLNIYLSEHHLFARSFLFFFWCLLDPESGRFQIKGFFFFFFFFSFFLCCSSSFLRSHVRFMLLMLRMLIHSRSHVHASPRNCGRIGHTTTKPGARKDSTLDR